jgi:SAM-dependent methyltransferase
METNWDQRYRSGDVPWDIGSPCPELIRVLDEYGIAPTRACEFGCGTGTNSIYLASRGFDVTGLDLSPTAIAGAEQRNAAAGARCRFLVADVFDLPDLGPPFPFLYDRGCYHVTRLVDEPAVIDVYDKCLAPGGHLLVLAGSANDPCKDGPPKVSEAEIRQAFTPRFQIQHLREFHFDTRPDSGLKPLAWSLLVGK